MSQLPPANRAGLRVLKFGGTSLATPDCVQRVVAIVADRVLMGPTAVVVSAFGGVTDNLMAAARQAAEGDLAYRDRLEAVATRHVDAVEALAGAHERAAVAAEVERLLAELTGLVQGVALVRECSPRTSDSTLSFGERLSSIVVAAALRATGTAAEACDARDLVRTDATFGNAWVDVEATESRIQQHFAVERPVQVVTGFIATTPAGETTTLGRGGSDYTATLLGAALAAEAVEIWTDVDGVMSADPRMVPEAFSLPSVSYDELMELSHWGAEVMHPAAVRLLRGTDITLLIRNTFHPEFPGTRVEQQAPPGVGHPVRGIASINDVALLRLEGSGMQGVPGIAERLFGVLARAQISVILITQASSERSICFAIEPRELENARRMLAKEFELERRAGLVDELAVQEHCSVVAAVGGSMCEVPGVSGRVFGILGHHRINVRAIAQGSSELNISLVVDQNDEERALRAIHSAFFLQDAGSAQLYVVGVGRVGAAFLDQVAGQADALAERGVEIRLAGLARSHTAALRRPGLALTRWREELEAGTDTFDDMVQAILDSDHPARLLVDCTASPDVVDMYEPILRDGAAVITANKLAFSGQESRFHRLLELGAHGMGIYFETTVGAGLPVLRTVEDLIATGDHIRRITGTLSGTLGFIFYRVMEGARFSDALREAYDRGFTEPDPREDLGGGDVARKLVILARVAGMSLEPQDVEVEPLLPDVAWMKGSIEDFWGGVPDVDAMFEKQRLRALEAGGSLSYLATIEDGEATVRLTQVAAGHACAGLAGTDNLIAITTDRYSETPLVVRGPGAGPQVTAAGVFADVLRALAESP